MALTFTKVPDGENVEGRYRSTQFDVTLDNSYPTGGYAITGPNVGLKRIGAAVELGAKGTLANTGSLLFAWDSINGKLMAFYPSGGSAPAAIAAPTVVTTPDAGATTMTGSAAKPALSGVVTGGQGVQVANATDLSSIVVRMKFVEY